MDIYKLDLEWQHTMLAHHVSGLLEDVDAGGVFLAGKHIGILKQRMEVIRNLQDTMSKQACEDFAQDVVWEGSDSITVNTWPSSQLCMDCEHGMFIMGEDMPASAYACKQGVQLGPCNSVCAMFEEKES